MTEKVSDRKAKDFVNGSGVARYTSDSAELAGVRFKRFFTREGEDPFDQVEWETRSAVITNEKGEKVFEQLNVEAPSFWSQMATNVVVSKYFRGQTGTPEREHSVRQLIGRVANTMTEWGQKGGYFASPADRDAFRDELKHLLLHQMMAFNSPVWFNCGVEERPQCSACFINSVEDTMSSILDLAKTEGMLFKWGSGAGSNLSTIRSSRELLAGGGTASGPVSFMRGYDSFAGVIKSGGKTRRAAKMVILNCDHPDIMDFIKSKAEEEKKAWALIDAGYDGGFNVPGGAYDSVQFQNANHSVRVTDEFMQSVLDSKPWVTHAVTDGRVMNTYNASDLMDAIADAAWICGDPGMQFDSTINRWHTCRNTARINASNPCSEYMFLDDSACNLSSLNLMKFRTESGELDVEAFRHACQITISAMEFVVSNASYPTKKIDINSHDFRPLGLGYANLGAFLMANGVPYDSDRARGFAAAVTALMCAEAYAQSARIASAVGPFRYFEKNQEPMLNVMRMHRDAAYGIDTSTTQESLCAAACRSWDEAVDLGSRFGYRNAQTTVLAPTGTIAFMMDCDTTGIEPDIALVKYKKLVGGGMLKIVNGTVPLALNRLGYAGEQVQEIVKYIDANDTIEGAPYLKDEDLPVFDCAFKPYNGNRSIHYRGHIRMMSAVQPFLSGAISKTVNMPQDATPGDIKDAYIEAWHGGLKAIAIYRDGSKRTQPLNTALKEDEKSKEERKPYRRRLPVERASITHKFDVAGHEGYITVGMYEDGSPGEIFLTMAKEGSTISGLMDSFATAVSLSLQYGVPLNTLVTKFSHMRFEPAGMTNNPEIPIAKSIVDYIFRWLGVKFLSAEARSSLGVVNRPALTTDTTPTSASTVPPRDGGVLSTIQQQQDAPPCPECGAIMLRSGSCYKCSNCGTQSGCS
ncbi:MAG: vitamin B12-dependent ribonucleotide reductase [Armatimonadetes bacterium]|nr:vitamin B12-dependent ribonucleotide reductase [Armatimonadota bacterium]